MKLLKKILLFLFITVLIVCIAAYAFIRANGKAIITAKLSALFGKSVVIDDIRAIFPLGVGINNLNVEGFIQVGEAAVELDLLNLVGNRDGIKFSKVNLIEPLITIERTQPAVVDSVPQPEGQAKDQTTISSENRSVETVDVPLKKENRVNLFIDKLIIKKGKIKFINHDSSGDTAEIAFQDIDLKAQKVLLSSKFLNARFNFSASVVGREQTPAGTIKGQGWVDFSKKDMQAQFDVANLDATALLPYYKKSFNRNLKSALLDIAADLSSKNNDMLVKCKLNIKNLEFVKAQEDRESFSFEEAILGGLKAVGQNVVLNLNFRTKMDNFKVDSIPFSGSFGYNEPPLVSKD